MTLTLDSPKLQIVDGNNLVLGRLFRSPEPTTGLRPLLDEVRRCAPYPPIIVFDGAYSRARRQELFPDYKRTRAPLSEDITPAFQLVQELLAFTPAIVVRVPGWEGDDVIATLAREAAARKQPVRVVSEDRDFAQLATDSMIEVSCPLAGVEAAHVHAYKATVGDPADGVKGLKSFGKIAWTRSNRDALAQFLEDYEGDVPSTGVPRELNLPLAAVDWWRANPAKMRTAWAVTALWEVPQDEMLGNVRTGSDRPDILEILLRNHFL